MISRTVLFLLVFLHCAPHAFSQNLKSIEGIRISQINGIVQLDSLVAFSVSYDSAGVLISRLDLIEQPNTYYIEKTFDIHANLIKKETKSLEGVTTETCMYTYSEAGEMTQRMTLHPGGDTLKQEVRKVMGIDDLLVKIMFSTSRVPNQARVIEHKYFSYDQKNRVSHIYFLNNNQKTREEFYSYDENDYLLEEQFSYLNPAFSFKKAYKYKKGILVQTKEYNEDKLTSTTTYNRNSAGDITSAEASFPKKNGVQTTYYQRKYWPQLDASVQKNEISRGDDPQTAEKP